MFRFFLKNKLITPHQSGFELGHSCVNQLLSLNHEIYKSFDNKRDVRSILLDISKAFDKSGMMVLSSNQSKMAGQVSAWSSVNTGVPQGSILGPLLFLIYTNDLSDNASFNVKLFTDDIFLFSVTHDVNVSARELKYDLRKIIQQAFKWNVSSILDVNKQAQVFGI